jgi:hypothetical protein
LKYFLLLLVPACLLAASGCGDSQDRSALAQQTVVKYWDNIGHARFHDAYLMNTTGNRDAMPYREFRQNLVGFLTSTNGVSAEAGKPTIADDRATVPMGLHSPRAPGAFHVFQHLFWENGSWKISDPNGGVSLHR